MENRGVERQKTCRNTLPIQRCLSLLFHRKQVEASLPTEGEDELKISKPGLLCSFSVPWEHGPEHAIKIGRLRAACLWNIADGGQKRSVGKLKKDYSWQFWHFKQRSFPSKNAQNNPFFQRSLCQSAFSPVHWSCLNIICVWQVLPNYIRNSSFV